ncbi:hypothetical protein [Paenibacillus sp. V4I3]|uniref:hypothetical protein n=1 Tax=Paenibacillus sp. V4I3 TaxID=3042305 RepID=UPI0027D80F4B|nr:hypothetical protein [Paenibacillus sp. V4I3]
MIVFDESMELESDVSDITLQFIQATYGPMVKDWLLLPGPVPILGVSHVDHRDTGVHVGAQRVVNL